MTLAEIPPTYLRICVLFLGLVWGSFLNVVIYRMPRGMSVVRPPSHCPGCSKPIPGLRNVPVLSWLLQGGRAACCGTRISARYPLIELAGAVLSLAVLDVIVLALPGNTPVFHAFAYYASYFGLALGLTAAAFIDLEFMIVPDTITFGGTVLGIGTFGLRDMSFMESLVGAAIGFLIVWLPFDVIYSRIRGVSGMGLGDAKLMMLAGAWFGWEGVALVLGGGAIQGTVIILIAMLIKGGRIEEPEAVAREREDAFAALEELPPEERAEYTAELLKDPLALEPEEGFGKMRIAFGPFLILATLEMLLLGRDTVVSWFIV